jgi:hypothetical protein
MNISRQKPSSSGKYRAKSVTYSDARIEFSGCPSDFELDVVHLKIRAQSGESGV